MTVHNYRSRQVHETLNGVNPSSGFRDMRSSKSGPNLYQIWQVFGPWASPFGANGQMTMTVHNYRPRQFYRTSNGENPSSGYRDMGSASLAAARPAARPPARPPGPWRQYPSSPEGWGVMTFKTNMHATVITLMDSFRRATNIDFNFTNKIFTRIFMHRITFLFVQIPNNWTPIILINGKSLLVHWTWSAPSHYLNQWRQNLMTPYGITWPQ